MKDQAEMAAVAGKPTTKHVPHAFGPDRRVRRRADFLRIQSRPPARPANVTLGKEPRTAAGKSGSGGAARVTTSHFVFLLGRTPPREALPDPHAASAPPARLGLVVTKKVGNAVVRNRIKRLCRECFRLQPHFLPNGVDLLVIARQGAGGLGLAEVQSEWSRIDSVLKRRAEETLALEPCPTHVSGARPKPTV